MTKKFHFDEKELIGSLGEALDHARGKRTLRTTKVPAKVKPMTPTRIVNKVGRVATGPRNASNTAHPYGLSKAEIAAAGRRMRRAAERSQRDGTSRPFIGIDSLRDSG